MTDHAEPVGRRIVCAAIRHAMNGRVILGVRHYDSHTHRGIDDAGGDDWGDAEQGFVDNAGEFLSREEAWVVARDARQIIRRCGGDSRGVLFSENLY